MSQPVVLKPIGKKKRGWLCSHTHLSLNKKKKTFSSGCLSCCETAREMRTLWLVNISGFEDEHDIFSQNFCSSLCFWVRANEEKGERNKKKAKRTTIMRGAKKKKRRMWASKRNVFKRRVCSARYPDIRHVCKHYQMVLLLNKRTGTHVCGPFRVTQKKKKTRKRWKKKEEKVKEKNECNSKGKKKNVEGE